MKKIYFSFSIVGLCLCFYLNQTEISLAQTAEIKKNTDNIISQSTSTSTVVTPLPGVSQNLTPIPISTPKSSFTRNPDLNTDPVVTPVPNLNSSSSPDSNINHMGVKSASDNKEPSLFDKISKLRSVSPSNLLELRLHPASHPIETEIRCGFYEPCIFSLSRGFAIGSDVFETVMAPILQPWINPGRWYYFDFFAGYQFFRGKDNIYANASLGYKTFSYKDSNDKNFSSKGLTFRINTAQVINSNFTFGADLSGYISTIDYSNPELMLYFGEFGKSYRRSTEIFGDYLNKFPNVSVVFPLDYELINWGKSELDLRGHIRGFLHAEPYFSQANYTIKEYFTLVGKNYGAKTGVKFAHEFTGNNFSYPGRVSFLASSGLNFEQISYNLKRESKLPAEVPIVFNSQLNVFLYIDLLATYQF